MTLTKSLCAAELKPPNYFAALSCGLMLGFGDSPSIYDLQLLLAYFDFLEYIQGTLW